MDGINYILIQEAYIQHVSAQLHHCQGNGFYYLHIINIVHLVGAWNWVHWSKKWTEWTTLDNINVLWTQTLFPNWQKESWQTFEETSGYVRQEWVNKWPNSMTDIWWWWWRLRTHKHSNSGTHSHSDMTQATTTQNVTIHNTTFRLSFPSTPLSHLHLHLEQGTALYLWYHTVLRSL